MDTNPTITIPAGPRSTESEITQALLAYLATCSYGEASFKNIFFHLPKYIQLTPGDWEVARKRHAEKKWHGIVRNIGAHANVPGNPIHDGTLVKRTGGGYQLASRTKNSNAADKTNGGNTMVKKSVRTVEEITVPIDVLEEDILNGDCLNRNKCMIRVAVERVMRRLEPQYKNHHTKVDAGHITTHYKDYHQLANTPKIAAQALKLFDAEYKEKKRAQREGISFKSKVKPFSFKAVFIRGKKISRNTPERQKQMNAISNKRKAEMRERGEKPKRYTLRDRIVGHV